MGEDGDRDGDEESDYPSDHDTGIDLEALPGNIDLGIVPTRNIDTVGGSPGTGRFLSFPNWLQV